MDVYERKNKRQVRSLHFQAKFIINGLQASFHSFDVFQLILQCLDLFFQRQLLLFSANCFSFPSSVFASQAQ